MVIVHGGLQTTIWQCWYFIHYLSTCLEIITSNIDRNNAELSSLGIDYLSMAA